MCTRTPRLWFGGGGGCEVFHCALGSFTPEHPHWRKPPVLCCWGIQKCDALFCSHFSTGWVPIVVKPFQIVGKGHLPTAKYLP